MKLLKCGVASGLFLFVILLAGSGLHAQQPAAGAPQGRGAAPAPPQNLQVLPKDVSRADLIGAMRTFTFALGVECEHCHVAEPTRDFASDAKQPKKTARVMMQMTAHINEMIGSGVGKPAAEVSKVTCATCHRGKVIPETPAQPPPPAAAPAPGQ
jgi:hypothetical protein